MKPADALLERVRAVCFQFAGADEKLSHGAPSFHVRGKMFVIFAEDHHRDGRVAIWCKATPEDQKRLVANDPERYFVPPYVGVKGWVGVVVDHSKTDWIEIAIIVEEGWASIVPKSIARGTVETKRAPPPPRVRTDEAVARAALDRLMKICAALPESECERDARHATFRVKKKVYAYFLDNHHGDGIVAACFRTAKKGENAALAKKEPKRFYLPAYIASRGYVGMRLDAKRVDWKEVAARASTSYRAVAPKTLVSGKARP